MIKYTAFLPHPPIMLKEIGGAECNKIKASINSQKLISQDIKNLEKTTDLLVIMSPHAPAGRDYIPVYISDIYTGNLGNFGRTDVSAEFSGNIELSTELSEYISKQINIKPADFSELDHGVIVPLWELAKLDYQKPILVCGLNMYKQEEHYIFGQHLAKFAESNKKNIIFVGSGDMSHALKEDGPYNFNPAGPKFDKQIVALIKQGQEKEFLNIDKLFQENAAECGFRSLLTIAGIKSETKSQGEVLSYEGHFGVGYLAVRWS